MRRCLIAAALVVSLACVGAAGANGPTLDQLQNAGWTCFQDPVNPRINCGDPGHGRPIIGDPDPPPTYNFKAFTLDGAFLGTIHLIRADLYSGQPCPQTGTPYVLIAVIGYYRCERL